MNKGKLGLRILLLVLGIFIVAHGIVLSIRSDLGTSAISSMPYVLNLIISNISVGTFAIIVNTLLVLIQILILRSKTGFDQIIQLPLTFLFGFFIDINLWFTSSLVLDNY